MLHRRSERRMSATSATTYIQYPIALSSGARRRRAYHGRREVCETGQKLGHETGSTSSSARKRRAPRPASLFRSTPNGAARRSGVVGRLTPWRRSICRSWARGFRGISRRARPAEASTEGSVHRDREGRHSLHARRGRSVTHSVTPNPLRAPAPPASGEDELAAAAARWASRERVE